MSRGVSPYVGMSDAELEAHIELYESYIQVDEAELAAAIDERRRRGHGAYELTEAALEYLAARGPDGALASAEIYARRRAAA